MEKTSNQKEKITRGALGKFLLLVIFLVGAVCLLRLTPIKDFVTPESLSRVLDAAGLWAPVVFILLETVAISLFVPASIPIILGAGLFGAGWGFFCGWLGALGGASVAFFVGRTLGRGFVASIIGDRLKKYDDGIERNGFTAVLYLRLLNSPFTPMNYGLSLTKVHFWDYFFGTGLGVMVSIFVITFLSGTLKEVWVSGNWENLLAFEVIFAVILFVFSCFIPMILKRVKRESNSN
ncbi:MAG: TVP38/TMEM64 family protein [Deltaproteobacteria bacterium]|uniref:TVP38/TMEM64 family membrane protein n=1 Tax=Candidatus Desulfacyla euxinica TaxID=2841693 RepID=A0A8J6N1H3_9DELT|nr:TVP38/TMEM64 family protein [Candidatus Desulfacyla euxinica]